MLLTIPDYRDNVTHIWNCLVSRSPMKSSPKYISSLKTPPLDGFSWQDPENDDDRASFRDILEYGCHIVSVEDAPHAPQFCFSIGFYLNLRHPEFFVMGLGSESSGLIINQLFDAVEKGRQFSDGERITGLLEEGRPVVLKLFPHDLYFDYLGYACWFYRSLTFIPPAFEPKFPVFQILWADKLGRFPFEEGCHPAAIATQALKKTKSDSSRTA